MQTRVRRWQAASVLLAATVMAAALAVAAPAAAAPAGPSVAAAAVTTGSAAPSAAQPQSHQARVLCEHVGNRRQLCTLVGVSWTSNTWYVVYPSGYEVVVDTDVPAVVTTCGSGQHVRVSYSGPSGSGEASGGHRCRDTGIPVPPDPKVAPLR